MRGPGPRSCKGFLDEVTSGMIERSDRYRADYLAEELPGRAVEKKMIFREKSGSSAVALLSSAVERAGASPR